MCVWILLFKNCAPINTCIFFLGGAEGGGGGGNFTPGAAGIQGN